MIPMLLKGWHQTKNQAVVGRFVTCGKDNRSQLLLWHFLILLAALELGVFRSESFVARIMDIMDHGVSADSLGFERVT